MLLLGDYLSSSLTVDRGDRRTGYSDAAILTSKNNSKLILQVQVVISFTF